MYKSKPRENLDDTLQPVLFHIVKQLYPTTSPAIVFAIIITFKPTYQCCDH